MDNIPGEKVRRETARWALGVYGGLAAFGIILHIVRNVSRNKSLNWLYLVLMAIVGIAALLSLQRLKRSLTQAMFLFSGVGFVCFTILLFYEGSVRKDFEPFSVWLVFHVGIFFLGLVLGFRPALYYAIASTVVFVLFGLVYHIFFGMVMPIALAYAAAVPAKVIDQLIEQTTYDLKQINQHLESLVAARTAELAENNRRLQLEISEHRKTGATLHQRTLELERRNEELDTYAQMVAHDIKAPLALLIGYAEHLTECRQHCSVQELNTYLDLIARSGRKIAGIVDALLLLADVSKSPPIEVLDMAYIVNQVLRRLSPGMTEKVHVIVPESWPAALGYAPWIEEVWVNYISNALMYGGTPLHIELGAQVEGSHIRFWVRDNGKGLTTQEQARLFVPFVRLNHSNAEGHGLGLSIVRRIVERLNGQVGVESEVGKGSTFFFTLPVAHPQDVSDVSQQCGGMLDKGGLH